MDWAAWQEAMIITCAPPLLWLLGAGVAGTLLVAIYRMITAGLPSRFSDRGDDPPT